MKIVLTAVLVLLAAASSYAACPNVNGVPAPHCVTLVWNASTSTSTTVTGYYIHRGTSTGGPYTKISPLIVPTTWIDADLNLKEGTTYYYVVTAMGANGQESAFSNEASGRIPLTPPNAPSGAAATVQ